MLRSVALTLLFAASSFAAIWPEQLGSYHRKSVAPLDIPADQRDRWDEYGLESSESADYGAFKVDGARFKDSTGAYAATLEQPRRYAQFGNYLVHCEGTCTKDLPALFDALPGIGHAPLPALTGYFPLKGVVKGSGRYIVGPKGLKYAAPQISEAAAAFEFGTEGAIAQYQAQGGPETLAVFSFPTPQMARQQLPAFEALPGAVAKRSGPLVALVLLPQGADRQAADKLLAGVNYSASVSIDDTPPMTLKPESTARMLLSIFSLAGIVLGFCLLSGLVFGGVRILGRKFGYIDAQEGMTWLHLSDNITPRDSPR